MRIKEWRVYAGKVDFDEFSKALGVSPLMVRIMCNRGLRSIAEMEDYLYPDESRLHSPVLMKDLDKSVDILIKKIKAKKKIRIIGDYDIDGVCSVAILYRGLKRAGADVDWYIPHRVKDGYGLNLKIVRQAALDSVDTILTCDNGISAHDEVDYATEQGMTVIITDHHDIPAAGVPRADAVVNPKQENCDYPFKELCGAAIAWKLIWALFERVGLPMEEVWQLIEFAAIATVGDVVELLGENRLIVKLGTLRLHKTTIPGLAALIEACGLKPESIGSYHIGFVLGPTINAGGRLDSARLSEELLLSDEAGEETNKKAQSLRTLNDSRKTLTTESVSEAMSIVDESDMGSFPILVIYLPHCAESIAGIVAGRLREHYYKPCIVLTTSEAEPGMAKGSGRSIPGYDMFHELERIRELMTRFGGHPMAAGMSLKKENIDELRDRLNENCTLTKEELTERLWIDIPLPIDRITTEFIGELNMLEPFGKGNEKPVFADRNIRIIRGVIMGRERNVLKLIVESASGRRMEALLFQDKDDFLFQFEAHYGKDALKQLYIGFSEGENPTCLSLVYYPSVNSYRGMETVQIVLQDYHFH